MLVAMDINATAEYSLKSDPGPQKTVFKLGFFDANMRTALLQGPADEGAKISDLVTMVKFGLRGWSHLVNGVGEEVEFKSEQAKLDGLTGTRLAASDDSLNALQFDWITELGKEILRLNFPGKPEQKN